MGRAQYRFVDSAVWSDPRLIENVAGEVLADELVIRHVGVQGPNEVVAVVPRVRYGRIAFAAVRVGIANQVHPVPCPVLSESLRVQQPPCQLLVGVGIIVLYELSRLVGRWRHACQVVGEPPDQRAAVGGRSRQHAVFFELGQHEAIHRVQRPAALLDLRRISLMNRLPGPVGSLALRKVETTCFRFTGYAFLRPWSAHPDPLL